MFMHVCLPISDMSGLTVRPTSFVIVLTLQFAPLHIHLCQALLSPAFLTRARYCPLFSYIPNKQLGCFSSIIL